MKPASPTCPPTYALVFSLWLVTLVFGAVVRAGCFLIYTPRSIENVLLITVACSIYAALFSTPLLLVLPFVMRWAFKAAAGATLWGRLLAAITSSFIGATSCAYLVLGAGKPLAEAFDTEILLLATPYLPAAVLAAICVYRPWLFQP